MARLRQMAQSVRRDIQKMKTKLVFRELTVRGERVPVAQYEPVHFIAETVGGGLAALAPEGWILLTPDRSLRWDGKHLLSAPAVAPPPAPHGRWDDPQLAAILEALPWV
jgi:DNA polymerase